MEIVKNITNNKLKDINVNELKQSRDIITDKNIIYLYNKCVDFIYFENRDNVKHKLLLLDSDVSQYAPEVMLLLNQKGIFGKYANYFNEGYCFNLFWGEEAESDFKKDAKSRLKSKVIKSLIFLGIPSMFIIGAIIESCS